MLIIHARQGNTSEACSTYYTGQSFRSLQMMLFKAMVFKITTLNIRKDDSEVYKHAIFDGSEDFNSYYTGQ